MLTGTFEADPVSTTYRRAIVLDFEPAATATMRTWGDQSERKVEKAKQAGKQFADILADQLVEAGLYETVIRDPSEGGGLRISGMIWAIRWGYYAIIFSESDFFQFTVNFSDNATGKHIGRIICYEDCGQADRFGSGMESVMEYYAKLVVEELRETHQFTAVATETTSSAAIIAD